MELPTRELAYIPPLKVKAYLLSETHAAGKSKAKFFRSLGFTETNMILLERGLLSIAKTETVKEAVTSVYGTKYMIEGPLETPSGRFAKVRTVWIIEGEDERPRFVTAYPA